MNIYLYIYNAYIFIYIYNAFIFIYIMHIYLYIYIYICIYKYHTQSNKKVYMYHCM